MYSKRIYFFPPSPRTNKPLDLLPVENLDGHFVTRELVFSHLDLAKAAMTECLSEEVPREGMRGRGGGGEIVV